MFPLSILGIILNLKFDILAKTMFRAQSDIYDDDFIAKFEKNSRKLVPTFSKRFVRFT